eukprot:GHVU01184589.1.p1 GENE.GHVU01184589.1~~GHVU01184589.1.p1  ORF type:complete len:106 (-),score=11.99 GHVU01184589.1:749-1066(-)
MPHQQQTDTEEKSERMQCWGRFLQMVQEKMRQSFYANIDRLLSDWQQQHIIERKPPAAVSFKICILLSLRHHAKLFCTLLKQGNYSTPTSSAKSEMHGCIDAVKL